MIEAMSDKNEPTDEEQRHYWRLQWLSSLQSFANETEQTQKWTDPSENNPHFSFVECMSRYFDDVFIAEQDSYQRRIARGYLTLSEVDALAEFHRLADQYQAPGGDDYDVEAILGDTAWRNLVESAQRAQACLLPLLTDPFEVAALMKPIVWEHEGGVFSGAFPDPA